jgi:hypothetical protein
MTAQLTPFGWDVGYPYLSRLAVIRQRTRQHIRHCVASPETQSTTEAASRFLNEALAIEMGRACRNRSQLKIGDCAVAAGLLWAHAEFLKLLVARERRRPIELLHAVEQRYLGSNSGSKGSIGEQTTPRPRGPTALVWHWRDEVPVLHLEAGRALLIEDRMAFTLHFGFDGWQRTEVRTAVMQPFGLWGVRLSAEEFADVLLLNFTRRFGERWEGIDHRVSLGHVGMVHALAPVSSPLSDGPRVTTR